MDPVWKTAKDEKTGTGKLTGLVASDISTAASTLRGAPEP